MPQVLFKKYNLQGLLLVLILMGSVSCVGPEKVPKPDNLLPEDVYIDLMVEVQHLITYRNSYPDSVNIDSLSTLIYNKYQVTEEDFLVSHEYYQKHVKEQIARIDEALRRLNVEKNLVQAHMDSVKKANTSDDSTARPDTSQIRPTLPEHPTLQKENL